MRIVFVIFYKSSTEFIHALHKLSFFVYQNKDPEFIFFANFKVIGSKSRCSMNDSASIFRSNKITTNDPERICIRRYTPDLLQAPGNTGYQLFIAAVLKPGPGKSKKGFPGKYFGSGQITVEIDVFILRLKIFSDQGFCKHHANRQVCIRVK